MSTDNAELLKTIYEAFGRGDIAAVLDVLDENIVWNAPAVLPHAMPVSGRGDVPAFFGNLAATWEAFNLEIDDLVASGDRVCMIGRAGGRSAELPQATASCTLGPFATGSASASTSTSIRRLSSCRADDAAGVARSARTAKS
jgi:ketosteroid isomerase-like protein